MQELLSIFYPVHLFDADSLDMLTPFYKPTPTAAVRRETPLPDKRNVFYPRRKNSLFWSIYIQIYGFDEFFSINKQKLATVEMAEQSKIASYLSTREIVTQPSVTKTRTQEIRSMLMTIDNTKPLSLLPAFAAFYKISIVVFLDPLLYYEIRNIEESSREIYLIRDSWYNYGVPLTPTIIDPDFREKATLYLSE